LLSSPQTKGIGAVAIAKRKQKKSSKKVKRRLGAFCLSVNRVFKLI